MWLADFEQGSRELRDPEPSLFGAFGRQHIVCISLRSCHLQLRPLRAAILVMWFGYHRLSTAQNFSSRGVLAEWHRSCSAEGH